MGVLLVGLLMLGAAAWAYAVAPEGATIRLPTRGASNGRFGVGALFIYPGLVMLLGLVAILAPQKGDRRGGLAWLVIGTAILAVFEVVFIVDALNG
ncbi:hypothetical protein BW730_05610 [Tessaracoccus aquimaris]|uniref:Uncharacterized protein n=1 Tax=Tessaracoccus aquimaris TaxID=1332264 RepID=A0A1Q2CLU2_9ACTN|nr:hypothetical protein BW730_05610 [Tessaracoccus aquimaris]